MPASPLSAVPNPITVDANASDPRLGNGFTRTQIAQCISPRRLELTLLPTEKCNFRCTYCYEDFELGRMPPHVVEGIKNLIAARIAAGLEEIDISWFGGEPLLAMPVIREVAGFTKTACESAGVAFGGGLTTNAYKLSPEVLSELVALNQQFFQITLDGWKDAHDTTRLRADGQGTFDVIWANLLAARDSTHPFTIVLRVHVTPFNQDSLRTLAIQIGQQFGDDARFSVNFQDVRDMGGDGSENVVPVAAKDFRSVVRELEAIIRNKGQTPSTAEIAPPEEPADTPEATPVFRGESAGSRASYSDTSNYICYAAKPNHLLIRANGRVGKCTVALKDPRNDLGFIRPDGTIKLDAALAKRWSQGLETLDIEKLGCPIAYWNKTPTAAIPVRLEGAARAAA